MSDQLATADSRHAGVITGAISRAQWATLPVDVELRSLPSRGTYTIDELCARDVPRELALLDRPLLDLASPVDWTPRSISLTRRYTYKGDRLTDPALRDRRCRAVLDRRGKCICGTLATMLVLFDGEPTPRVIMKRCLRKLAPTPD